MDNVTARINHARLLLPNPALMSSLDIAISNVMIILSPVIMDERVVQFVNSIRQQDMKTELLRLFWAAKDSGAEPPKDNHTYLTSISFLLSSPGIPHSDMIKMFDEIERVFDAAREQHIRAEAADIMHRFYPARGKRMLGQIANRMQILNNEQLQISNENEEAIRMQQIRLFEDQDDLTWEMRREQLTNNLVYYDEQNVHNTAINESVISAARALIEEMVATVTFAERYKLKVFRDDTVKSVTRRLAAVINRFPEDVTILGYNAKQTLQPQMTYMIAEGAKTTIKGNRYKREELEQYHQVLGKEDFLFPDNVSREGDLGRRLEEIFIATNHKLTNIFENIDNDQEFSFYLNLTGIPDVELIWLERKDILKHLYVVVDSDGDWKDEDQNIDEFLHEIFDDIFPDTEMDSFIRRIKMSSVRDIQLIDLLNAVWKFIHTKQGETFTEMKKRLKEEILEVEDVRAVGNNVMVGMDGVMVGMDICPSGICAHLVSVIQGYFDEDKQPALKIKMSLLDELKAELTHNINR